MCRDRNMEVHNTHWTHLSKTKYVHVIRFKFENTEYEIKMRETI